VADRHSSSSVAGLAFTGSDVLRAAAVGGLLVAAGGIAVLVSRRSRRRPRSGETMGCVVAAVLGHTWAASTPSAASSACGPVPVLPESPLAVLLPVLGVAVFLALRHLSLRRQAQTGS
jgi:hypothetical protein